MIMDRDFYDRDTLLVARELLGRYLVRFLNGVPLAVRICETEAYIGRNDKACHAYGYRRTARTEAMFAPPGTAYVYMIYGIHHCLNLVTEPEGEPCAVLVRGGQARAGLSLLARNRCGSNWEDLAPRRKRELLNGPGKLCRALAVTRRQNGYSLLRAPLYVCDDLADIGLMCPAGDRLPFRIRQSKRIGVAYAEESADLPWRFYIENYENSDHTPDQERSALP